MLMGQDLAHKRPWLLASLIFGLSYPLTLTSPVPGVFAIIWKMAAVGLLIPYALRRHHHGDFLWLAVVLAFCALGDGLVEISLQAGAVAFAAAHLAAIWLYSRHRRAQISASQKLLAAVVLVSVPLIAWALPADRDLAWQAGVYAVLLSAMAAMAWTSAFPRYRVGTGAILFVMSDLLIFAREGSLGGQQWADYAIWYLYYIGMLLITIGVVQTLLIRGRR
ncbi:MAG: lysoplasmalogenase family protein [Parasphingorhabdus sp.]|nr:lysoplasmalogenase family protein [Parasphingorhabdus sp.]